MQGALDKLEKDTFNSIKVRLKRERTHQDSSSVVFQFHKGAIETTKQDLAPISTNNFQFHKGAIETLAELYSMGRYSTFNSIKVRLKLPDCVSVCRMYVAFNSIKVRLKLGVAPQRCPLSFFQFHKGAIET